MTGGANWPRWLRWPIGGAAAEARTSTAAGASDSEAAATANPPLPRPGIEGNAQAAATVPPVPPPAVISPAIMIPISVAATGFQAALMRAPRIKVRQAVLASPPVRCTSWSPARASLKVQSFVFPALAEWLAGKTPELKRPKSAEDAQATSRGPAGDDAATSDNLETAAGERRPRGIRPPRDVIKLEDRLFYMLQPPIESWMSRGELEFPFRPFPYQFEGVAFLYPRQAAILADEMGLGKTMQAITAVRLLLHSREIRSALLICPKPLVTNWQREFARWAPELPVSIVEGDQAKRRWLWALDAPVRIANYELLQRDRELVIDSGSPFDLVILDEAQRIKNRNSTTAEIARSISRRRSWALTGTPIENSVQDLVGIFEFLSPGAISAEMRPDAIGEAASDYVLRRTKDQVLTDMPPKLFRDVDLELTGEQRAAYQQAEEEGTLRLSEMGDSITIQHVFELVLRLKQICNFDPASGSSCKFERLEADLEEVADSGRKALVFSQWVTTLNRLSERLQRFGPLQYHGQIPSGQRDGVIERFRNDPDSHVLLMSYGAGSVGLNLQFAEYVFLFDRWWNPAVEDQAVNRAHRIGAAGPVTVCRFLTQDTIEQRIDQVLCEKRQLFETIFNHGGPPRQVGLTQQEIFGLFRLKTPGSGQKAA